MMDPVEYGHIGTGWHRMKISVRELKDRLSEHLRMVQSGQSITVTSHRKPIARLSPVPVEAVTGTQRLVAEGMATWNGKKPRGARGPGPLKLRGSGPTVADMVLADRG
jgi:prevent-host-death family protein